LALLLISLPRTLACAPCILIIVGHLEGISLMKKSLQMSKFRSALRRIASVPKDEVKQILADERAKRKSRRKS